jgi:hypothetical protein
MSSEEYDPVFATYCAAIGHVSTHFAKFELLINEMIWLLANVGIDEGACITAQIPSPLSRLRAFVALVAVRGGQGNLINELNSFSVRADSLARRRNRVVHDPWIKLKPSGDFHRIEITADRKLNYELAPTTIDELMDLGDEIGKAIVEFGRLSDRIRVELPPWPNKQFLQSRENHPVHSLLSSTALPKPGDPPRSS